MDFIKLLASKGRKEHVMCLTQYYQNLESKGFHTGLSSKNDLVCRWNYLVRLQRVCEFLSLKSGESFLDVGCGDGSYAFWAVAAGAKFGVGIELDANRLRFGKSFFRSICAKMERVDFVVADARFLPFRDEVFDKVLCMEALEHIYDFRMVISELGRMSKKKLVITTPSRSNPLWKLGRFILRNPSYNSRMSEVGHIWIFDAFELRRELEDHLQKVDVRPCSAQFLGFPAGLATDRIAALLRHTIFQLFFVFIVGPFDKLLAATYPIRYFGSSLVLDISRREAKSKIEAACKLAQ